MKFCTRRYLLLPFIPGPLVEMDSKILTVHKVLGSPRRIPLAGLSYDPDVGGLSPRGAVNSLTGCGNIMLTGSAVGSGVYIRNIYRVGKLKSLLDVAIAGDDPFALPAEDDSESKLPLGHAHGRTMAIPARSTWTAERNETVAQSWVRICKHCGLDESERTRKDCYNTTNIGLAGHLGAEFVGDEPIAANREFEVIWFSGRRSPGKVLEWCPSEHRFAIAVFNTDRTGPTRTYEAQVVPRDDISTVSVTVTDFGGPGRWLIGAAFNLIRMPLAKTIMGYY